jgi:3-dehydroquinate dehydratase/shikimate dehydrogenase
MPHSTKDVLRVFRAAKETGTKEKILFCMGHLGVYTKILAERFGSSLTYASALSIPDVPPMDPGQLDIQELAEVYRFRRIGKSTKVYGVIGFPLASSGSPRFFNTVFNLENTDAVFVPFPTDSISDFMDLAEELGVSGLSVTVPYNESVLSWLTEESNAVKSIGACNSVSRFVRGWQGINTDALGFSDSLLAFLGKKNLKHRRITVLGAGGAARAALAEIYRLGGKALVLNRTIRRARELALPYKYRWGGLDGRGIELMYEYQDIIIQTTSAGMEGCETSDPLPLYEFSGTEMVMDLVYKPELPPFLRRASAAGCKVINGYDMLIRQARYQYAHFMGKEFPSQFLSRVQFNKG